MRRAREFEFDYWDGERRYGYGGYQYKLGRWRSVAEGLIERYCLQPGDKVLDIGCGKGYLLYDLQQLMPELQLYGLDRSLYAVNQTPTQLNADIRAHYIQDGLPFFRDREFALVMSLGCLHNLTLRDLWTALPEIQRVGRHGYIMVESFRNEQEWFNLCAWCLTAESLMRPEDWEFLFRQTGYRGDFEFIYFL